MVLAEGGATQWQRRSVAVTGRGLRFDPKRPVDLAGGIIGLIVLLPLLAAIAVVVRLDSPGPVIFTQARIGQGGRRFRILKFRTLRAEQCDGTGVDQVQPHDPRLTRTGAFLRRTSLDELPQLLNVIAGDMSLVGPRPHVPGMLVGGCAYASLPSYERRHALRPGMTGLAQVSGLRGPVNDMATARSRLAYDLAYVRRQSLRLDLRIIGRTVWREVLCRMLR